MINRIHLIWFLVTTSDAFAGILIAYYFHRLKTRFGHYLAGVMISFAIESLIAAAAILLFWQNEIVAAPAFAFSRLIGRTVKSIGAWLFVAYLFYWINGDLKGFKDERTIEADADAIST